MQNSNSRKSGVYRMIDLFAGCGGLSLGFENAGFTPVFVNELNKDAMSTYLNNRHHKFENTLFNTLTDLHCNDAHELDDKRLDKLKSDLKNIKEINFLLDKNIVSGIHNSNLDVIAGGPPCQGFSGIGHRRSYSVDKDNIPSNHLYQRMCFIINKMRPRTFLFENVRGLLNSKWYKDLPEKIFPDVLKEFRSINGYKVRWDLVYAKDYGVAQNRPRVMIVGIRDDIISNSNIIDINKDEESAIKTGFLPSPDNTKTPPDLIDLLGDLIDPKVNNILRKGDFPKGKFETIDYPKFASTSIQKSLRSVPEFIKNCEALELTEQEYSKHNPKIVEKFSYMLKNNGIISDEMKTKKFSQRLLKPRWGNGSPNITATSLPDDYVHFSQPRSLTVREWARIQMFPDWYQFSGKRTTGGIRRAGNPQAGIFDREVPKYTQIGNAVPVKLAEAIGSHLKEIIDEVI